MNLYQVDTLPDLLPVLDNVSGTDIINWFFKAFAVLFSIMFLLYAVIIYRQTQIMNQTVTRRSGPALLFVSLIQIIMAMILVVLSIFFI